MGTLLGIDLGTSSVKVVLSDDELRPVGQAVAEYEISRPGPGAAEIDPERWWGAVLDAVAELGAAPGGDLRQVSGVGFSGQMHGLVLCDEAFRPVRRAMLWPDTRASSELQRYRELSPGGRLRLGNPLSPGMAGPMLGWLARHEPDALRRARWALSPKDWLRARLTGRAAAEPSDASATLLYDVLADGWHAEVVEALGIEAALLPGLLDHAGSPAGEVTADAAASLGLPAGVVVAAGAGDAAAAALGSGLLRPGPLQLVVGTGVQLITASTPPSEEGLRTRGAPVTHLYRHATPDGWYSMAAGLSGGQSLGWVRRLFGVEWAELYAAAEREFGEDDPIFVPHLNGERTPHLDPGLRGSWSGLSARHDREAMLAAALEGVAFGVADALDALPEADADGGRLRLAGGGSVAPAWRQLLADVLGWELEAVEVTGASARGAVLLAGAASGYWAAGSGPAPVDSAPVDGVTTPSPERTQLFRRRRERFTGALRALAVAHL